ncbi:MAG: hypothetical protein AMJ88_01060 [Anaerolineae bacterium SM23_ 63]|nr:MAG: hypothetical protein AMJ88_01060 [Anaerolineae bacterium SM23_ 63]
MLSPSTSIGQALRPAQDEPFDKLRTGPSTGLGRALRHAQGAFYFARKKVILSLSKDDGFPTAHPSISLGSFYFVHKKVILSLSKDGFTTITHPTTNFPLLHGERAGVSVESPFTRLKTRSLTGSGEVKKTLKPQMWDCRFWFVSPLIFKVAICTRRTLGMFIGI